MFRGASFLTERFQAEKDAASSGGDHRSATTTHGGNSMGKTRVAISAIVLGLAIGSTGVASAAPQAECAPAFEAMTIEEVLSTIASPDVDPMAFFDEDRNDDLRLCIKIIPNEGGPPQFNPAFVFVDNHI
jgi:hypothetical protein